MAEEKDDLRRVEFILNEQELQLERGDTKTLFEDLDTSPEAIIESPLNLLLSNFDNEYMKSERMGVVLFDILNESIRKYSKMVNENFYYQDMELVFVINDLVHRYNVWLANQRGLILSTRALMVQVQKMVDKNYTTNKSLENFKEEVKMQMDEDARTSVEGMVGKIGDDYVIVLPKNTKLRADDFVLIKKSKKIK